MCLPFPITDNWRAALQARRWHWVDSDGDTNIDGLDARAATPRTKATPSARFRVMRELALQPGLTQAQWAALSKVTQGRVAQVLASLPSDDVQTVVRLWLEQYPGPGGLRLDLARGDPLAKQVADLAGVRPDLLVSGALAAEHLAAWTTPRRTTAYTAELPLMSELNARGFVEVDAASEATVVLRVPADSSVLADRNRVTVPMPASSADRARELRLADLLQICADLDDDLAESPRTLVDARTALLALMGVAA